MRCGYWLSVSRMEGARFTVPFVIGCHIDMTARDAASCECGSEDTE